MKDEVLFSAIIVLMCTITNPGKLKEKALSSETIWELLREYLRPYGHHLAVAHTPCEAF
jgi:hypothetical protein